MLSKVRSLGLCGIEGFLLQVEVNLSFGMPAFDIVGLPDLSVKESRERVRAAVKNCGYGFPAERLVVNLAPADIKKEGPALDLPIALGVLACAGEIPAASFQNTAVFGELSLSGEVRPVRGALNMVVSAAEKGVSFVMLPAGNLGEVSCVSGIGILPVRNLQEAVSHFQGKAKIPPAPRAQYQSLLGGRVHAEDFQYIKGQKSAKRALEIAAAGGHNVLLIGPPGSGKTLMARSLPSILPDMTFLEALEVTRVHSASGSLPETGLMVARPFRAPHHTASNAALIGGGINALPGEISKAHNGVLFLDELPEFRRDVLEALRQPIEDGFVTVARVSANATYPARISLVCAMNPCPCGNFGSARECRCTPMQIRRYLNRVSGPLLDRMDMQVWVDSIPPERLGDMRADENSADVRARVSQAREVQKNRYKNVSGVGVNAHLGARTLDSFCPMTNKAKALLQLSAEKNALSSRAYTRILKVARTIADLAGEEILSDEHIAEAVQYRALDRKYWG